MERLANSSDADTRYYWGLAFSTFECPNWIARWFLYHVFRYRDGRNRGGSKTHNDQTKSPRNSKSSAHKHTRDKDNPAAERSSQQGNGALISGSEPSPCTHEYSSVECFTSTSGMWYMLNVLLLHRLARHVGSTLSLAFISTQRRMLLLRASNRVTYYTQPTTIVLACANVISVAEPYKEAAPPWKLQCRYLGNLGVQTTYFARQTCRMICTDLPSHR